MISRVRWALRELDVFIILGALLAVAALFKASTFYNLSNLFAILELSAVLGIATLGEALVLIVKGVNVSVGAVMGFAGTLSAYLLPTFRTGRRALSPPRRLRRTWSRERPADREGTHPAAGRHHRNDVGLAGSISEGRLIPIDDKWDKGSRIRHSAAVFRRPADRWWGSLSRPIEFLDRSARLRDWGR